MGLMQPASRDARRMLSGRGRSGWLALLAMVLALPALARVELDTMPGRDTVQLTIYNSVDLTLVRETRFLTLRQGMNRLEFSWAGTLIDPSSVEFKALTHADEVEVVDASFPPRVTNTLEWRINSGLSGEVQVEIHYFTSGISWAADYAANLARDEKSMTLAGQVRVSNQSGEDYENAQIRLVVGKIKLVDEIAALARPAHAGQPMNQGLGGAELFMWKSLPEGRVFGASGGRAGERPAEIVKEGVSEYFLYTVEGRDTIPSGWSKRLPSFTAVDVPLASYYKYEKERWGGQVMRYYRFKNDTASQLGREPLPDGSVKAFRAASSDQLQVFTGRAEVKYIPINETVELELGPDPEVLVKPELKDWRKDDLRFDQDGQVAGWTTTEVWRVEALNSREIEVTVDLRRNFSGDWTLKTDASNEKMDANKVKFLLSLKPREKQAITYEVVTRHGLNATR